MPPKPKGMTQPFGLFKTFSMYYAGPLPKTVRGNKYVKLAVDHLTGWPVSRATSDQTCETAVTFILEEIVNRFGARNAIMSDNGFTFMARAFESILRAAGVK